MEINWNYHVSTLELALRQNIRKFEFWNSLETLSIIPSKELGITMEISWK